MGDASSGGAPRHFRRNLLKTTVAAVAGTAAAACATAHPKPVPAAPVMAVSVYLLGGVRTQYGDLSAMAPPLRRALAAATSASGLQVSVGSGDLPPWLPKTVRQLIVGYQHQGAIPEPTGTVPDVVITQGDLLSYGLAALAADLTPHFKQYDTVLQGIPQAVLHAGRAYGGGRVFQAALPLLRIPLLCAVGPGVQAVHAGKAWTAGEFRDRLAALVPHFTHGGSPLSEFPWNDMLEIAAIGSGGRLGVSTSTTCRAVFADRAASRGILELGAWTTYMPSKAPGSSISPTYAVIIPESGAGLLLSGYPVPTSARAAKAFQGWTVAPVPVFPARPAVTTRTIVAFVSRTSAITAQAIGVAMRLLSTDAQTLLASYTGGLALRQAQALKQMAVLPARFQGPELIANGADDITGEDALGTKTPKNAPAQQRLITDLFGALPAVSAPTSRWSWGSNVYAPSGLTPIDALQQAQAAANAGKPYPPG